MHFSRLKRHCDHPLAVLAIAILLALVVGGTAWRIHSNYSEVTGEFDWSKRGLSDYHNGTYLPTQAFIEGESPYSPNVAGRYRMARSTPPYSPVVFLVHIPLTWFELHVADVLGFGLTLLLLAALSWLGPRMSRWFYSPEASTMLRTLPLEPEPRLQRRFTFLGLLTLIVASRPGHMTLFTGYFTAELVLGTIVALHYAHSRPVVAGLGMMMASGKPTFILPLIFLMICRRNFRAVIRGIAFCTIAGVAGLAWLSSHAPGGLTEILDGIRAGQNALHGDVTEYPVNVWTRTDLIGMWAKFANSVPEDWVYLTGMIAIMLVPGFAVWRISRIETNGGATGLSSLIITLTIMLAIYHHAYECLLLVIPWIGVSFYGQPKEIGPKMRMVVAALLAFPALNYASTKSVRDNLGFEQTDFVWQLITVANGACLLVALVIALVAAFRLPEKISV